MSTPQNNITFIGAGNMARSIIGGLVHQGYRPDTLCAADPNTDTLERLTQHFGVRTTSDNAHAVASADVVVLAVKPQVMGPVCDSLASALPAGCLVISIAAGITCKSLQGWLGDSTAVVRCMPNTPALVQMGASGLFANEAVTDQQKSLAQDILSAVGIAHWVTQEALIDAVTAVSGSGPAYFFLMLEAMVEAGVSQGLSAQTAQALAIQTAAGAAKLAQTSDVDLAELRRRVTSPGGTTEKAIEMFEQCQLRSTVKKSMDACKARAEQMAEELGN